MNFKDCMEYAKQWWDAYVETGISPDFDEKKDKEYLDIIRATDETKDSDLLEILELLFVFKTSYTNLTNRFDQLSTRYRDLIRERDED